MSGDGGERHSPERWHLPGVPGGLPGWLRPYDGESHWPVVLVVLVAIAVQVVLPDEFVLRPKTLAPSVEGAVLVVLAAGGAVRPGERHWLRPLTLALTALLAVANAVSTGLLVHLILTSAKVSAVKILASGAGIWLTNVTAFALWYWQFDRGGPAQRSAGRRARPDFLFPQMSDQRLDPDWRPLFLDYLYVSFTNAAAFSPTDTMPLSRWAKLLMMAQSIIALITVGLVAARAVNILPTS